MNMMPSEHQTAIETIAQNLQAAKQQAIAEYWRQRRPLRFFMRYRMALDEALSQIFQLFFSDGISLLAIGGFGRGEIYPYSDIDLALVFPEKLTLDDQQQVAQFVQTLWDWQLTPAVKTGTVQELASAAKNDLTADTALLEARFLCGHELLAQKLIQTCDFQRQSASFIEGKLLEMEQRHHKQQGSGSVLEPNIKTCPGGLRDIHTMLWLAKAQGLNGNINLLIEKKILTKDEASILHRSHKQLAKIRIDLHLAAKREEDRLIFDLQSQVAENMKLENSTGKLKSEKLMYQFYRSTKAVKQLTGIILPMLRGRVYSLLPRIIHDIDSDYYQIGNQIAVHDLSLFRKQPEHIFKIIEILQQRRDLTSIAPKTLRAWWLATRQINRRFYENEINRQRFIGFFKQGNGLTHTMRFLNLYGALGRYLPAWEKIVGLLQHDLFHIYPVDDHILMVLRNTRRLMMEQHSDELPFASSLMSQLDKPYLLYLAAMFHDIAKGRYGDHAQEGIADAHQFACDHFLSEEESDLLCWLVENHLLMSLTAQKEDIHDPHVIKRFAQRVATTERLHFLYLLTVADIRGTNPKIWNSWKANLLETLFHATERYFNGKARSRAIVTSRRQNVATAALDQAGFSTQQQIELSRSLGAAYFVRYQSDEISWQVVHLAHQPNQAQVLIRPHTTPRNLQIMVYMPDAERLFAGICRIISRQQLNIVAARAFVTAHHFILDTFIVQLPEHTSESDIPRIQAVLQKELEQFLAGKRPQITATPKLGRRARYLPISPIIELIAEDENHRYTLNIIATNRPYLLADIADTFNNHQISLLHAQINTLDERVEDSFSIIAPHLYDTNKQLEFKRDLFEQLSV